MARTVEKSRSKNSRPKRQPAVRRRPKGIDFAAIEEFDVRQAGKFLDALLKRIESTGERLYLRRGKKRVAALVPTDEAEYLEQLEERHWAERADKAMEEPGTISLEQVKKELGL